MYGLSKWFGKRAPRTATQPRRAHLRVEALEDRQVLSVAAGPHGEVFATFGADHHLWEKMPAVAQWQDLKRDNVTSVSVGANGTLDVVLGDSSLQQLNAATGAWTTLDTNVGTVAVGPHGEAFYTHGTNRQLFELPAAGSSPFHFFMDNVASVSAGADGRVDVVRGDGSLWQLDALMTKWTLIYNTGADAVAAGPHGEVFATWDADHHLSELDTAGVWHYQNAINVMSLSVGADGVTDAVFTRGSIWQLPAPGGTWVPFASGANTEAAGPSLAQSVIQFGLTNLGVAVDNVTANHNLFTCANFVASALQFAGAKTTADFGVVDTPSTPVFQPGGFTLTNYQWASAPLVTYQPGVTPVSALAGLRAGDVLQFREVTSAPGGPIIHQHTAIVYQNAGNGKLMVLQQNFNGNQFVTLDPMDLSVMNGGTIWVYRPEAK
jgi:hypothetical protein